jgi:hypothetical protein
MGNELAAQPPRKPMEIKAAPPHGGNVDAGRNGPPTNEQKPASPPPPPPKKA